MSRFSRINFVGCADARRRISSHTDACRYAIALPKRFAKGLCREAYVLVTLSDGMRYVHVPEKGEERTAE